MSDINDMSFSVSNNITDLVNTINKNIFNFHKIVHKLQQNYKTNKHSITILSNEIKYLTDNVKNINDKTEQNENMIDSIQINIKDIKNNFQNEIEDIKNEIENKQKDNNKKINDKFMYYISINIFVTSVICLVFSKIY
jgi:predicted  nucleic acid-binding Zn-ribbon protein